MYPPALHAPEEKCLAALGRDGAVILANAVSAETCDQVVADMAPYIADGSFLDGFYGKRSKRIGCLPARYDFLSMFDRFWTDIGLVLVYFDAGRGPVIRLSPTRR